MFETVKAVHKTWA